jgi:two-component system KDP operon response regulator KdpE
LKTPLILVVDDEPSLLRLVRVNLESSGYRVAIASKYDQALTAVASEQPDLVVLDVMLHSRDGGFDLCRRIREFSDVPIVMLTARVQEEDKLTAFALGADDYVTKPFSTKELLARIDAVLRRARSGSARPQTVVKVGHLTIDQAKREAMMGEKPIDLTPTEFKILQYLANNAGKVVLHSELLTHVWGEDYRDEVDYLRVYMSHLRQKIEADPANPQFLITKPGVGYSLCET